MPADPEHPYVSRGGLKLRHALDDFDVDPTGLDCADLGASVGGFTDCLLQAGARRVVSVDTAYGQFAWKLRNDPRVNLRERANALHEEPPPDGVDLVVIDLGWTPQRLCVPAALRWLRTDDRRAHARIISLIKPHYEATDAGKSRDDAPSTDEAAAKPAKHRGRRNQRTLDRGVLEPDQARAVFDAVIAQMPEFGARVIATAESPIAGSKGKARGNVEYLALLASLD